jgi:signal transduction histidine kinase/ActR/RegA family two-component response regulator
MLGRAAVQFTTAVEKPAVGYLIAGLSVGAAVAARLALGSVLAQPVAFPTFYPAVMVAALIGGLGPGLAAAVVSGAVAATLWIAGPDLRLSSTGLAQLLTFWAATGLMVVLCAGLRLAVRRGFQAEQRFRAAQEASRDAFVILSPIRERGRIVDFRWLYANPAADALKPPGAASLVGLTVRTAYPGQPNIAMMERLSVLHAEGGPDDLQVARTINGVDHWMRSSGVRLGDDLAVTFSDITKERAAEEAQAQFRRDLERQVAERTRALEASQEERARTEAALAQAQRLETVGRLTGGVAHDFNNLLTVIIGGLDMILRDVGDTARVRRLAEAALDAGKRGERLNQQLLAFSRNQELKPETVDAAELLAQIEPLVRRAVSEATPLTIDVSPDAGFARIDPAQFEAALLNLVVNAADATAPGDSIAILVNRRYLAEGEVSGAAAGDHVCVAVRDSGAGMSPDILARVFEPFFTTKDVGKGTGLGLAQVYGFVRQCGGAVTIESDLGAGATVTMFLPAAESAPRAEDDPGLPVDLSSLRGASVLLVEDDEAVRSMTEGLLAEFGARVTTDYDGASAKVRLAKGKGFDLLLTDVIMPGGVSGVELARYAAARFPHMKVVLSTGYAGDRLQGTAISDLPWPVLRKPFRGDQLAKALVSALRREPEPN